MMNDPNAQQMPPEQMQQQPEAQQMPMPQQEQQPEPPTLPDKLKGFIKSDNIATDLKDDELLTIGQDVVHNTKLDDDSRKEWKDQLKDALAVAKQVIEEKSYPWPKAANVKLPLILTGCVQFNARTFPQMKQGARVVKIESLKARPTEADVEKAKDLSAHMSYQLLQDDSDWLDDKDKLLMVLPMVGTVFTKTYYDPIENNPQVDLCLPDDVIINQKAKSLEKAQRITHAVWLTTNQVIERQRKGLFLDMPLDELMGAQESHDSGAKDDISENLERPGEMIDAKELDSGVNLHLFHEQCNFLDLDGDGYAEPYITTVHVATKKVMRIVARYNFNSFSFTDDNKTWVKITPDMPFTSYIFLPSFDNTFYGMGFSQMLYPINAAANSILNRLLDAGTLSNMQSGFIGKGVRMRKQTMRLKPGEWMTVSTAAGVDLSRNIVPLPTKEPSSVLFELLGMLVKSAQEISGVSDVMQGQLPPANTPATTVVNIISEGSKVYSSIRIRLTNAMRKEFLKLYKLNKTYLGEMESFKSAERSGQVSVQDYLSDDYGVTPVANASMGTEAQQLSIMQAIMGLKDDPILDKKEIYMRFLDAMNVPDAAKLFAPPPPPNAPPPPEVQKIMAETKLLNTKVGEILAKLDLESIKLDIDEKNMLINAEAVGGTVASQKVGSMVAVAGVEQLENKQRIEQAAQTAEQVGETPQIQTQDVEQKIQDFEGAAGQQAGIQPQQTPQSEPGVGGAQQGTPAGGDQGLQQSLADKMEQVAPQPAQPQGGENLPLGESSDQPQQ